MLKTAVPDPVQLKLRQNKKNWNKEVSTFINDLIHFKKTMNGAPSKFSPEKGDIKNPIPADPASLLENLSGSFQDIAQKGNRLVQEQLDYSKNRRKSVPKNPGQGPTTQRGLGPAAPVPMENPAPTTLKGPDLTKQLASSYESKYEMVVEGSNFLSRFIARLTNPPIGFSEAARIRRARMDLLDTCVKVYKGLIKLQVEVVKSSKDSIPSSNKLMQEIWNNWTLVSRGFAAYQATMPAQAPDSGGKIPEPQELSEIRQKSKKNVGPKLEETPEDPNAPVPGDYDYEKPATPSAVQVPAPAQIPPEDPDGVTSGAVRVLLDAAKAAVADYSKNYRKLDHKNMSGYDAKLEVLIIKYRTAPALFKSVYARKIVEEHKKIITSLNQALGTSGANMADVFKQLQEKEKAGKQATAQLEVLSQALLRKWLGKTMHQLNPFDKTSNARLNVYNVAEELRKTINKIMDSLEKDMNVEELSSLIGESNKSFSMLRGLMRALHLTHPMKGGNPVETTLDKMDTFL